MTAERRQNFRLLMTLECAINVGNRGFRRCRTRDISQEGAFVVGDTEGLTSNSQVTLAVQTTTDGRTQVQHFRAIVRHLSESGVGLYVSDANTLLKTLLARRTQGGGLGAGSWASMTG
jgi:c-di-GMP-binding flagellar brake protein YcgR